MLSSVIDLHARYGFYFNRIEWCFTLLFTIEYTLRILCTGRPFRYIFSFYGIVDLLSIIPTYLSVLFTGTHYFLVIRVLRILRIFRVLKLAPYISQGNMLTRALLASRQKITIFFFVVFTITIIFGAAMYLIEGPENGFTSIPRSVYWAIVTLTTVGYGDIAPKTVLGQALAALVMIIGYAIIAVPTGIFTAELAKTMRKGGEERVCVSCGKTGHEVDAVYCDRCGAKL